MKKNSFKKGNNLVEYALVVLLVGIVGAYGLSLINPDVFRKYFGNSFSNSTSASSGSIRIGPMGDADVSGISLTY